MVLLDGGFYIPSEDHEFLSDIPDEARLHVSDKITNVTFYRGTLDGDEVDFGMLSSGRITSYALFADTGDPNTSPLILYTNDIGEPFQTNGSGVRLVWDVNPKKIFQIPTTG